MRYALTFIIIFFTVNFGINAIKKFSAIQDQKTDQLCQIDQSYCKQ